VHAEEVIEQVNRDNSQKPKVMNVWTFTISLVNLIDANIMLLAPAL
jgi:hypothetical protein